VLTRRDPLAFDAIGSTDGVSWTAQPATGLVEAGITGLESIPGGLLAFGDDEQGQAAWVSADAVSWRRVSVPEVRQGCSVIDLAARRDRVVFLGCAESDEGGARKAAWLGPASLLAP
jgi:hypothetical protein